MPSFFRTLQSPQPRDARPQKLLPLHGFFMDDSHLGSVRIVHLHGVLDGDTAMAVTDRIHAMIAAGTTRVVFDLSGLHYIASAGLGAFISGMHDVEIAGGSLQFANPSAPVKHIFAVLGVDAILPIHDHVNNAIQAVETRKTS